MSDRYKNGLYAMIMETPPLDYSACIREADGKTMLQMVEELAAETPLPQTTMPPLIVTTSFLKHWNSLKPRP